MVKEIEVNGNKISIIPTVSRFSKSAHQISEEIYWNLRKVGIGREHITLNLPRNPLRRDESAEVAWIVNNDDYYFKCDAQGNYRDNLGVIGKVIHQEVYAIKNGMKSFGQVMNQFILGYNETGQKTITPREIIGVPADMSDLDYVTFKYKRRAKELHPDVGGTTEQIQELNKAYNTLKDELESKDD